MLKALVQLFAETFLVNKKEWIQRVNGANTNQSPVVFMSSFIAPYDGYVLFTPKRTSEGEAGCYFMVNGKGLFEIQPIKNNWTARAVVRVSKGDSIDTQTGAGEFEFNGFKLFPLL